MKIITFTIAAALAACLMGGAAFADDAAPAKPAPTKPAPAPVKPPSAKSVECYKQADARQLHNAPRKKFYAECLKAK
jgi:hypothetical protein